MKPYLVTFSVSITNAIVAAALGVNHGSLWIIALDAFFAGAMLIVGLVEWHEDALSESEVVK